ncbi:hypothetical protein D5086_027110, partial [Populus alba]
RLFLEQLDLNTGGLRHLTHMTTPSPSCDSSSEEHLPRVRSSIQMNIEEVSTLAVLTEDVAKDTPTTNLLVMKNPQEMEARSNLRLEKMSSILKDGGS